MKHIFTLLCALMMILGAQANPQRHVAKLTKDAVRAERVVNQKKVRKALQTEPTPIVATNLMVDRTYENFGAVYMDALNETYEVVLIVATHNTSRNLSGDYIVGDSITGAIYIGEEEVELTSGELRIMQTDDNNDSTVVVTGNVVAGEVEYLLDLSCKKPEVNRQIELTVDSLDLLYFPGVAWQIWGHDPDTTVHVSMVGLLEDRETVSGAYGIDDLDDYYTVFTMEPVLDDLGYAIDGKEYEVIKADLNVEFDEAKGKLTVTGVAVGRYFDDVPEFILNLTAYIPAPTLSDMTFEFAEDEEGITVTPSNDEDPWDYYIVPTDELEEWGGIQGVAELVYAYYYDFNAAPGEYTFYWDDEIAAFCQDDDGKWIDGEYVLVVWGAGLYNISTEVASYEFTIATEGIENIQLTEQARKVIMDGVLYIVRDNKIYDIHGTQVR